jgi:hypothetical protein
MDMQLLLDNLLSPPVLFFLVGIAAALLKSDLSIPDPIPKLFSIYLLWAIGYKGGVELNRAGLDASVLVPLGAALALSALTPLWVFPALRWRLGSADAGACAAAFGSVSAVTFITAENFLVARGIDSGGYMVAALALMEAPAIVVGVMLYRADQRRRRLRTRGPDSRAGDEDAPAAGSGAKQTGGVLALFKESLLSGPVFLLLGSMLVGLLAGDDQYDRLRPFTYNVFYGVLMLFLLEAGIVAAKRLRSFGRAGVFTVAAGIVIPLINAAITLPITMLLGLETGDAFLLMILAASASYIAVPAAMRDAIPEANASVYLTVALGVTFPFNIALGIPLYLWVLGG